MREAAIAGSASLTWKAAGDVLLQIFSKALRDGSKKGEAPGPR
jgi:hypothetical protein